VFTVMFVLYESPSIDREKALAHWRTAHAEIVRSIPGVRRYVQHAALRSPDGLPAPFLGIAERAFDDEEAFGAASGSAEFAAAMKDLCNFADPEKLPTAVAESFAVV
jgi:uncharacterized protein (TIGR02118 family)